MTSLIPVPPTAAVVPAFLFVLLAAHAQAEPQPALWELGAFGVGISQQANPGSAARVDRLLALPFFVYRGKILRVDRGSAGIRAVKTPEFELDVGVASACGSNSDDIGARRGMAFEPTLLFERRARAGWHYQTSLGSVIGDRRLAGTFYGVAPAYATPQRPAYAARSGLIAWRLGTPVSYPVTTDLRLFGFARVDTANPTSPLVDPRTGASVGLGRTYTFARSQRPAVSRIRSSTPSTTRTPRTNCATCGSTCST